MPVTPSCLWPLGAWGFLTYWGVARLYVSNSLWLRVAHGLIAGETFRCGPGHCGSGDSDKAMSLKATQSIPIPMGQLEGHLSDLELEGGPQVVTIGFTCSLVLLSALNPGRLQELHLFQ